MTTEQFIDQVLPKCTNLESAITEMMCQANIDAQKMAEEDPLSGLSESDKKYLSDNPDARIIPRPCYFGFGPTHVVLRKR